MIELVVGAMMLLTPAQMDDITAGYRPDLRSSWGARYDNDAGRHGFQNADRNAHTREFSTGGLIWMDDGGRNGRWVSP